MEKKARTSYSIEEYDENTRKLKNKIKYLENVIQAYRHLHELYQKDRTKK